MSGMRAVPRRRRFELPVLRVQLEATPGLEHERGRVVGAPHDAARILAPFLEHAPATHRLAAALLDDHERLLAVALLDGDAWRACCLRPSEVYAPALVTGATSLYLAHLHPAKQLWALRADCRSLAYVWRMSDKVGVRVHDHLIFDANGRYASLRASQSVWSNWRFADGTARLRLPACPPHPDGRTPALRRAAAAQVPGATGTRQVVARSVAQCRAHVAPAKERMDHAMAPAFAVPPLGFELCGLRVRLVYDVADIALDRQPIVRSHADVAPLLARFVEHPDAGLVAALVGDNARLFAIAHMDGHGGDACSVVAPGALYRAAIVCDAHAVYLAHRHAAGVAEVTPDDLASAARVYMLGFALGQELRDSLIFDAHGRYVSLRERGEGAQDWGRARDWNDPDYPRGHMRLYQAGDNRRPERPGSTRSHSARAALWRCPTCERLQNYKHACRYCETARPR